MVKKNKKNKKILGMGLAVVILLVLLYFGFIKQQQKAAWEGYEEEVQSQEEYEEAFEETEDLPAAVAATAGCMDTDGGLNFAAKGTVSAEKITETDTCSKSKIYTGRLYEEYCTEEGLHARYAYDCPSGICEEGACVAREAGALTGDATGSFSLFGRGGDWSEDAG